MVLDPYVEQQVLAERVGSDGDQYDEVWEGVYIVTPLPNNEHQEIVSALDSILQEVVGRPRAWSSASRRESQRPRRRIGRRTTASPTWPCSFAARRPINCGTHWRGAADFLVEIISPGERTRDKIPFYSSLGVVELLIIDREPWTLELYRHQNGQLEKVGQSTFAAPEVLSSQTVGLTFQLLAGQQRPKFR